MPTERILCSKLKNWRVLLKLEMHNKGTTVEGCCHKCGKIDHFRAMGPNRIVLVSKPEANLTLAISAQGIGGYDCWILDSESSRHLCRDESWLEYVEDVKGVRIQPNGDKMTISKVVNITLRVSADGKLQNMKISENYIAVEIAHSLRSYGESDAKGYVLDRRVAQRVLETCHGKGVVFDLDLN